MAQLSSSVEPNYCCDGEEFCRQTAQTVLWVGAAEALPSVALGSPIAPANSRWHWLSASTVDLAVAQWRSQPPDLALVDLTFAKDNGLALLKTLGTLVAGWPLPVVVITEAGEERLALQAMKLGAADYLFKADLTAETLDTCLSQCWDQVNGQRHQQLQTTLALNQAQQLYQNLVENSPDIIERFDLNLRHLYVSPALSKLLGISTDRFLGKSCREVGLDEAMVTNWEAAATRLIATGEKQSIEFMTPTCQGVRYFEMVLAPEWSDLQTLSSILCISRDITDRKAAEIERLQADQLRHELHLLEHTLESILAGYWDIDFKLGKAYMSPGLKRMLGYTDDELPTELDTWQRLILPDDLPLALQSLERHLQSHGQEPYYVEVRYRHKNGSTVWVICAGRVIDWDEAGLPLYMVGCHVDITPLKRTEANLQRSEAHLREAQRIGNVGSWQFDIATDQITWSDQLFRIFGLEIGAIPPGFEALQAHFHPEDRDRHRQVVEAIIATHQPYSEAFRILRPDGTLRHIQVTGEVVLNGAGELTHLTGVTQDVTDHKQADAQLEAISLRLSLALKSGGIGTWELDTATYDINWDRRLYEIYGLQDLGRPVTYQDWYNLLHVEDREPVETAFQALLDHDIPLDLEFRVWRTDGELRWIKDTALMLRDAQGNPIRMIGTNSDITPQKQAESQMRDLSLRLALALESGKIGTWEIDLTRNQINWDQRMAEIYGHDVALGANIPFSVWRNYLHAEDVECVDVDFASVLEGNSPSNLEFRIWRADGELRWIKATALVQRDATGRLLRMIGTNSDITEAKRAEGKLISTSAQLEASNRELEAFAYSVSHDLRAPLRAIDGFSLALLEDYGDQFGEEAQDYFSRIRHNVKRMGLLIDDLLRLSRVSRAAMVYTRVNLSALVQEQVQELQAMEPERSLTLHLTPNLTVLADPTLMQVVIANLVQNAWKFTSHHPTATLEFGVITQPGESIYYLRDDGAGFDMTYASKLFGVFQRLHNTDEFSGTGIGLATVQRIIHRHGGRIWAEAAIEQGATFYFTLPSLTPLQEVRP